MGVESEEGKNDCGDEAACVLSEGPDTEKIEVELFFVELVQRKKRRLSGRQKPR